MYSVLTFLSHAVCSVCAVWLYVEVTLAYGSGGIEADVVVLARVFKEDAVAKLV